MKVLQINSVYGHKSTGRIAYELVKLQKHNGIAPYVVCGEGHFDSPDIHVMSGRLYQKFNILLTRLFGKHGFYNKLASRRMIKFIDKVKPDVIHLHNIHGHYINIKLLFEYIEKKHIPVVWTFHDCWAFTGHCPHFDYIGCEKWKTECSACPQRRGYPGSWFFDRSAENFRDKKKLFTSLEKMRIVTPSQWLASLARESFFGKYPIEVVSNGIDTKSFAPVESGLRKRLGLEDKFIIMGIVSNLTSTKGGKYFLELSERLKPDEHIVLVSLEQDTDNLPDNITPVARTESAVELSEIYSGADVFVNPTMQDTFSMVNIEALACGVPVVTFATGGCPETINENCGISVRKGDTDALYKAISEVRQQKSESGRYSASLCRERAVSFASEKRFERYIEIYREIVG